MLTTTALLAITTFAMTTCFALATAATAATAATGQDVPATQPAGPTPVNLAVAATPSASYTSEHETLASVNDGHDPRNSDDHRHGAYGNWPRPGTQWVQFDWPEAVRTDRVEIYWWDDFRGVRLPKAYRLQYWDGTAFVDVPNARGLGLALNQYNATTFDLVSTDKLRLEIDSAGTTSTGVIEWKVFDAGGSPDFPPVVSADIDRVVVMPAKTHLRGSTRGIERPGDAPTYAWTKASGPGAVTFADPAAPNTTAAFDAPGAYVLRLNYTVREVSGAADVNVRVEPARDAATQRPNLRPVHTRRYKIDSPLWNARAKALITKWVPYVMEKCDDPNLAEGGIDNFVQAAHKLAGRPAKPHGVYPFSNAWVVNVAEAMCVALQVDPQGDAEIVAAQDAIRAKLEKWIPIFLAAQEPDGYLQTRYTLGMPGEPTSGPGAPERWSPRLRDDHEGYIAGYFIELGIAHHLATEGKDARLYDAARKLADCWVANIGPAPKKPWWDGHQELEMALVRLGRYVDEQEGAGQGRKYVELAKFLLDCRGAEGGKEYDQSHRPVTQQYAAVGHAVRAVYSYAGMADVAMETGDADYWSATHSLWDNLVNRKWYVTGGVGSGQTAEGFGGDYELRHNAYCESCSGSGVLFFQHKLNLATRHAKYADLYETTLYNAILGDTDLAGENFTYTNALTSDAPRYKWHGCPCCVGNIPRTLLALPTWMYATDDANVFVNLFVGSTVNVGKVAGTDVELLQDTDYPWDGRVKITVNPAAPARFALNVRVPTREVSALYRATPAADGLTSLAVNGERVEATITDGYATIDRAWKAGDTVEFVLPLVPQRVHSSDKVAANRGRVAVRYGPLIYNAESVDGKTDAPLAPDAPLTAEWSPQLLGGVMAIKGTFTDGSPMTLIPNYARLNRGGRSLVWLTETPAKP